VQLHINLSKQNPLYRVGKFSFRKMTEKEEEKSKGTKKVKFKPR